MNSLNFIGDFKLLSKELKPLYDSTYVYEDLISVSYNTSVQIKVKDNSFFIGIINIFNKTEIEKGLNIERGDDFDLVYSLVKTKGIKQAINEIDGEFAFAFFDNVEKTLYLVRDKAGIYPLYYANENNNLIFSSFVHDIPKLLQRPNFSERGLFEFIYMYFFYEPDTFYEGVYEVPIGTILEYDVRNDKVSFIRYFDFDFYFDDKTNVSEEECIKQLRERIFKAVKKRLNSKKMVFCYQEV
jgi:asparagine synthase (glutamine-hydrolysing)